MILTVLKWTRVLCHNSRKDLNGMLCCNSFKHSWFKLRLFTNVKIWSSKSTENLFQNLATVAVISRVLHHNSHKDPNDTWFKTQNSKPQRMRRVMLLLWNLGSNSHIFFLFAIDTSLITLWFYNWKFIRCIEIVSRKLLKVTQTKL